MRLGAQYLRELDALVKWVFIIQQLSGHMTIACNTIFRHKNKNLVNYFMKTTALTFATKYRSFGRNACELSVLSNRSIHFLSLKLEKLLTLFNSECVFIALNNWCTQNHYKNANNNHWKWSFRCGWQGNKIEALNIAIKIVASSKGIHFFEIN